MLTNHDKQQIIISAGWIQFSGMDVWFPPKCAYPVHGLDAVWESYLNGSPCIERTSHDHQ